MILKLEIEPAAEKSSAYGTILMSEFVFVLVISNTISMSGITNTTVLYINAYQGTKYVFMKINLSVYRIKCVCCIS